MRMTFILPEAGMTGGVRVVGMLAKHLQGRGHAVTVLSTPVRQVGLRDRVRGLLRGEGWRRALGPSHLDGLGVRHEVCGSAEGPRAAEVPEGDAVIATWWETAEWVSRMPASKGAKMYFVQLDERQILAEDAAWGARVARTYRLPLFKIATSRAVREMLREFDGEGALPVAVNGVDLGMFFAGERGKQSVPTVGVQYLGMLRKGPDVLSEVLGRVSREMPGLRVEVITQDRGGLRWAFPAGTRVHVDPAQGKLREIYAGCDVWLCASRAEGFHLPPMEAMACRCPVVSTRVGGPVDMVEEGVNGFLAEIGDVAGLTEGVRRVLGSGEAAWRGMSAAAHATARRYTWEAAAEQFERAVEVGLGLREGMLMEASQSHG
jgi:glycosyltransferase involved in cell wall biosynthesis